MGSFVLWMEERFLKLVDRAAMELLSVRLLREDLLQGERVMEEL